MVDIEGLDNMKILMVASENDVFPGGKVGGIGDVIRDIPIALAHAGQHLDVVIPGYGAFSKLANAQFNKTLNVMFQGCSVSVEIYKVEFFNTHHNVNHWIVEHANFAVGGVGKIYCNDPDNRPFASDASKFALFSAAVAKAIIEGVFGHIDVLHLHDWHTAIISVLRAYDNEYQALKKIKTVYTIHNLALQGIRPFYDDESSLAAWFPQLTYDHQQINDPQYPHCFNPMRAGINLSDKVHAVSPNYALEILRASDIEHGFIGGEGLQNDLQNAVNTGRLHGILNGCEYPTTLHDNDIEITDAKTTKTLSVEALLLLCKAELIKWIGNAPLVESAHLIAMTRISQLLALDYNVAPILITSVGRITNQKVQLFQHISATGESALERLLTILDNNGIFILLGSGDAKIEAFLTKVAAECHNFIFMKGYSEALPESIYCSGDMFLMPSSFEPCGISQMLSMRAGQPCLAHSVGGLADTIKDEYNGFLFDGDTPDKQVENMLSCFKSSLDMKLNNPNKWSEIAKNALDARFLWKDAAESYIDKLYQ